MKIDVLVDSSNIPLTSKNSWQTVVESFKKKRWSQVVINDEYIKMLCSKTFSYSNRKYTLGVLRLTENEEFFVNNSFLESVMEKGRF